MSKLIVKFAVILIVVIFILGILATIVMPRDQKEPGKGSSGSLTENISLLRVQRGLKEISIDNNLCAFAMQRANEYKLAQDKNSVHDNFEAAKKYALSSYLSGYKNVEESVLIYEEGNAPVADKDIAEAFLQKKDTPIILDNLISLGCVEEEPYQNFRYFVFIGASK